MKTFTNVCTNRLHIKLHWRIVRFLTLCLSLIVLTQEGYGQVHFPGGRVALSFDGNLHDPDDWGAAPMALAMLEAAGLKDQVVHVEYNNHLTQTDPDWESEMIGSLQGAANRLAYPGNIFYNIQRDLSGSVSHLSSQINESSAGNPLWIICAGPIETVYRAMAGAQASKRQYVRLVSHSRFNELHDAVNRHQGVGELKHNWDELRGEFEKEGARFYDKQYLGDQNVSNGDNDFSTPRSKWYWLRDSDNATWQWLYGRDKFSDKFDVSDAGMVYWLLSGGPDGGCKNCGWAETKALLELAPTPPPVSDPNPPVVVNCTFRETNGLVVIEAEAGQADGWAEKTVRNGYTGSGYLEWTGSDQFNAPGTGAINYQIYIGQPGTYRFQWRSRNAANNNSTEHNDTWLRFPDATDFYGQKGNSKVYPHGSGKSPNPNGAGSAGWFKVYTNQGSAWEWQTTTSDRQNYPIYASFESPGVYTLQVSGRSKGHAIDRMVLSHSSRSASDAATIHTSPSPCYSTEDNTAPIVNIVNPINNTTFEVGSSFIIQAEAQDTDGSVEVVKFYNGKNLIDEDRTDPFTCQVERPLAGECWLTAVAIDNEGAETTSNQVRVAIENKAISDSSVHAIPGKIEAEDYATASGIDVEPTRDIDGESNIGWINRGDYVEYTVDVSQAGRYQVAFRVASATKGGTITLIHNGTSLGQVAVKQTGSWQRWQTVSAEITLPAGSQTLRLQFGGDSGYLFNVNHLNFVKISDDAQLPNKPFSLTLYNALTDTPIAGFDPITEGAIINLRELGKELSIVANVSTDDINKVQFDYNNETSYQTERKAPYAIQGDNPGFDLRSWTPGLGNNQLTVIGHLDGGATKQVSLNFTVTDEEANAEKATPTPNTSTHPTLLVSTSSQARTTAEGLKTGSQGSQDNPEEVLINAPIQVYPNPANELLYVKVDAECSYQIASHSGRVVQSGMVTYHHPIPVSNLKEGLYYVRLTTKDGVKIQRFFVHR